LIKPPLDCDEGQFGRSRNVLIRALDEAKTELLSVLKFMHLRPLSAERKGNVGQIAEEIFARGICLPGSSSLPEEAFVAYDQQRPASSWADVIAK